RGTLRATAKAGAREEEGVLPVAIACQASPMTGSQMLQAMPYASRTNAATCRHATLAAGAEPRSEWVRVVVSVAGAMVRLQSVAVWNFVDPSMRSSVGRTNGGGFSPVIGLSLARTRSALPVQRAAADGYGWWADGGRGPDPDRCW